MLQNFAAFVFFILAGGALTLIVAMLSAESEAIVGALRGSSRWVPARQVWPARVRFVSMLAPVASARKQQRAFV